MPLLVWRSGINYLGKPDLLSSLITEPENSLIYPEVFASTAKTHASEYCHDGVHHARRRGTQWGACLLNPIPRLRAAAALHPACIMTVKMNHDHLRYTFVDDEIVPMYEDQRRFPWH